TILLATCYGTRATASLGAFLGALGGVFRLLLLLLCLCCRRNTEHSNDCEKPKHGPPPYDDNVQQYVAIKFATMAMSAFGPKQTCRKTQSKSLLGVKRTWLFALHMSACDPKRTSPPFNLLIGAVKMARSLVSEAAVKRREFFKGLVGATVAWSFTARAQDRVRRIAVLMTT